MFEGIDGSKGRESSRRVPDRFGPRNVRFGNVNQRVDNSNQILLPLRPFAGIPKPHFARQVVLQALTTPKGEVRKAMPHEERP